MKKLIQIVFHTIFCFSFHHTTHRTPPNYAERREELRANVEYYKKYLEGLNE